MSRYVPADRLEEQAEQPTPPKRHPLTTENSPQETVKRMRSLPERADKLREALRELRAANPR
jgi:hypothetical protein